jgi:hypothetical protein
MKKAFFTKKTFITILIPVVIIFLCVGLNFVGKLWGKKVSADGQWLSDQTNFIQQLYWPSYCVQIAEKNNISIDDEYKQNLKKYTQKILSKRTFNKISTTFLLGQLLWLNDYYQLEFRKDIIAELKKCYVDKTNLFSYKKTGQNNIENNANQIDTSFELYTMLKNNPENLATFNLTKGFSDFLAQSNLNFYSRGQIIGIATALIESENQDLFDKNKIYNLYIEKTDSKLMKLDESLASGNYEINMVMVSCAKDFSDYKIYFENNSNYINLDQEIYNKITSYNLLGYDKSDPLFGLSLSMIGNAVDLRQNKFIASNYNKMLTENFYYSLENNLIKSLGR